MIHLILDGNDGMSAIHTQLAEVLDFPSHYGRNLDALYDCLTELSTDVTIYLENQTALGRQGIALADLLKDAAEANPHIHTA